MDVENFGNISSEPRTIEYYKSQPPPAANTPPPFIALTDSATNCKDVDHNAYPAQPPQDWYQRMMYIGDTKAGTYIATDRYGNKYYENLEDELPLRTRWVDYKQHEYSPCQIEPGWHAWMSYLVDKPPTEDAVLRTGQRVWELPEHRPNLTASRAAFRTYST
ncbi:MAG: hypothetical protein Q9194_000765, partial [Teloschistes cf. exilis]